MRRQNLYYVSASRSPVPIKAQDQVQALAASPSLRKTLHVYCCPTAATAFGGTH